MGRLRPLYRCGDRSRPANAVLQARRKPRWRCLERGARGLPPTWSRGENAKCARRAGFSEEARGRPLPGDTSGRSEVALTVHDGARMRTRHDLALLQSEVVSTSDRSRIDVQKISLVLLA